MGRAVEPRVARARLGERGPQGAPRRGNRSRGPSVWPLDPIRRTLPVGPLQCNCTILFDPVLREAVVVDPGDEAERIVTVLRDENLRTVALLHTNAHFDHLGSTRAAA